MKREEYATHVQHALQAFHEDLAIDTIIGHEMIDNTLYVDQTSIGKTPRSCPATFVGLFDDIRTLYAGTNEAKYLGFGAGHFSFNSDKGRCLECD
jgi:excinuclease ABC subunit A